jgi:hypothetical protein
MKKKFWGRYVSIPYKDLIELIKTNKVDLGIEDDLAQKIVLSGGAQNSIRYANLFWNLFGFVLFILFIYFSFILNWYLFIFGFFAWYSVYKTNKKSNSSNILAQAKTDKEFYEKVRKIEGWIYNTDIQTAKKYKIRDGYPFEEN